MIATLFIGIFQATNTIIWTYAPKMIVSFVEQHYSVAKFIWSTVLICSILFIANALNRYGYTKLDYEFVKTNAFLERLRMRKMFKTDFKIIKCLVRMFNFTLCLHGQRTVRQHC